MLASTKFPTRMTYYHSTRASQFLLHSIREGSRDCWPVRIVEFDSSDDAQEARHKDSKVEESLARTGMGVLLRTEDTQDIVVFMDRFSKVPPLLFIPPVAVGISELTLHTGRVGVVTILEVSIDQTD